MKNEIVKLEASPVVINPVGEQADTAAKINYYHEVCRQASSFAIRAAVEAGVLLAKVNEEKKGSFLLWIHDNCKFGKSTAYKYMSLAANIFPADFMLTLAECDEEEREESIGKSVERLHPKILTDLYREYGIVGNSNLGGARPGSGRKKKEAAAALAEEAAAAAANLAGEQLVEKVGEVYVLAVTQGAAGGLETERIRELVGSLDAVVRTLRDIVKSRKE